MNLKQIEAFVCVAELGSYSKAAKRMFLTQPTVSSHIFTLEKELNVRLFIRNTKEVYLTEEGRILYKYAKEMVALEQKIEERFKGGKEEKSQGITIAASTIPSQYLLPGIISAYHDKYPGERFKIIETDSQDVVSKVVDHVVDLGLTGTVLDRKHCKYIPFYQDELVIVTANNAYYQKIHQAKANNLHWFEKEPIILRELGSGTRKEGEKQLIVNGVLPEKLNVVATIENQETIKKSVCQGIGISIMSRLATMEEEKAGKLLVFEMPGSQGSRDINLVYNKNFPLLRAVNRFIKVVEGVKLR